MLSPRLGLTLLTIASALTALTCLVQAPAAHADFGPGWRYECYPGEGSKPLPHQGIAQKKCRAIDDAPEQGQVGRVYLEKNYYGLVLVTTCASAVVRIGVPDVEYELIGSDCHNA